MEENKNTYMEESLWEYSVFIFTLYADYIDASADWLTGRSADEAAVTAMHESGACIKELAASIRYNTEQLQAGALSEVDYIEGCMWISLETMIKLLACSLTPKIGPEFDYLTQAVAQLAFEYGRLVLLTREQKLLPERELAPNLPRHKLDRIGRRRRRIRNERRNQFPQLA